MRITPATTATPGTTLIPAAKLAIGDRIDLNTGARVTVEVISRFTSYGAPRVEVSFHISRSGGWVDLDLADDTLVPRVANPRPVYPY